MLLSMDAAGIGNAADGDPAKRLASLIRKSLEHERGRGMAVYIIRHSDKEPGEFRSEGLPLNDQPLSAAGRAKAAALVGHFEGTELASIRVSEYVRTRQTIQVLAEKYPEFWEAYLSRDRDFRFPGGESGGEARATRDGQFACWRIARVNQRARGAGD